MEIVIWLIIGIIIGVAIGWLLAKLKFGSNEINKAVTTQQLEALKDNLTSVNMELKKEREKVIELNSNLASTEADYRNIQEKLMEQKEEVRLLQQRFKLEFQQLANDIMEEKSQKFTAQNQDQLSNLLKPLGEKIMSFEKKVEASNKENIARNSALQEQLRHLKDLNLQITKEAENLTKALKGDNKQQGNWGEFILESILEKSGLTKGREYFTQQTFLTAEHRRIQPDIIVKLPDDKNIIIDAKVSLTAYERLIEQEDGDERLYYAKDHLKSIKNHINGLSKKAYDKIHGVSGLDFVLLFIPIEPAFNIAMQYEPDIFDEAYGKNIIIVSPSTLIATLRTISNIWKHEYQNKNALEIARQSGALYDKFVAFSEDLVGIGEHLNTSQNYYRSAIKKLSEGKGNLVSRAKKIQDLGAKTRKLLDEKGLNKISSED